MAQLVEIRFMAFQLVVSHKDKGRGVADWP